MPFPVDSKFIDETEVKLGVKFPDSFRFGMIAMNGGEIATVEDLWHLHRFFDTSDKNRLKRTSNNIVRESASAMDWSGFPKKAVAIASGQCGDVAILLPDESDENRLMDVVFRWNHETREITILAPTTAIWINSRS